MKIVRSLKTKVKKIIDTFQYKTRYVIDMFVYRCIPKCYEGQNYDERKTPLAIVAIAKNECASILEWCAFHKAVGVDKIILYDNDSSDGMKERLRPFIDDGFVEYRFWPGIRQQYPAYNDALKRYGRTCRYMAFIDCDEFLMPTTKSDSIVSILDTLFSKCKGFGGCCVNWCMYGSSGHETTPKGLMIEEFTWRANLPGGSNGFVKTIVRPECVRYFNHPHYPVFKYGFWNVNFDGDRVDGAYNKIFEYKGVRINHYFTKSKEQWIQRRSMGKADGGPNDKRTIEEFYHHDKNEVIDLTAFYYLDEVKEIIKKHS